MDVLTDLLGAWFSVIVLDLGCLVYWVRFADDDGNIDRTYYQMSIASYRFVLSDLKSSFLINLDDTTDQLNRGGIAPMPESHIRYIRVLICPSLIPY
jgi:hypothetical protein